VIAPHLNKPFSPHGSDHWVVEGAPIVIPFKHVFIRPTQGEREPGYHPVQALFSQLWNALLEMGHENLV